MPARAEVEGLIQLYRAGRLREAVEAAQRFTGRWPGVAVGWNVLAASRQAAGDLDEAASAYRRALDLEPGNAEARNNLGVVLTALGRPEDAAAAHREALRIKPDVPPWHYNLGMALEAQGRPREAVACYRRAIAIDAAFADAHNRLGNVLRELGAVDEAEACYRRVLELQPGGAEVHGNLGNLLADQGRLGEAEASYRRALELRPDFAEGYGNLGNLLRERGRMDEAEAAFRKALELRPDLVWVHDNLGNALADLGRLDDAVAAYRRALALRPDDAVVRHHLAMARRFGPGDPDLAAIETALAREDLPSNDRMHLEYAAGKACEDLGDDPDRTFGHYREGARLRRDTIEYDGGDDEALFAAIERAFDAGHRTSPEGAGHPSEAPVFIVGMPRSGTSLVEQMLASHPRVHGAGERRDLARLVASVDRSLGRGFPDWIADIPAGEYTRLGREYCEAVVDPAGDVARVTDKMPDNFMYLGLIRDILPNARVIHVVRDPVDTCLSCFTHLFGGLHAYSYDLGELGRYYRAHARLMDHWRGVLPEGFMLDVRYEELVSDPEAQVARLLDHCGLEWDPACMDFHRTERAVRTVSAAQVRQPLYRRSIGRWKPYRAHLQPLLAALGDLAPRE